MFFHRLTSPNSAPSPAPRLGPSTTEPITTGTCKIVALISGRSISPKGVKAISSKMAANSAVSVSSRIVHILRRLYKKAAMSLPGLFLQSRSRSEAVATFMAVLELMKARRIRLADGDSTILFLGKDRGEKGGKRHAAQ